MVTFHLMLLVPILLLLLSAFWPTGLAERRRRALHSLVAWTAGSLTLLSLGGLIAIKAFSDKAAEWRPTFDVGAFDLLYIDGMTLLMLALVSSVGLVVARFSLRYLDGDPRQGSYFRGLGFTLGAVSLMVVSGNLAVFFLAWVGTSTGLHQLLLHYRERPGARHAAWSKFAVSRLGDALLIGALLVTYRTFGTLDFAALFVEAKATVASGLAVSSGQAAIAWLLVLGAATKSAQFPFHHWLPNTMETPTPVSALMHAGIVNAGGFLIIRLSPIVALNPQALLGLALVGAFTACFAGLVMMTQVSVKRGLAYSTIAQMGFMMLQCGLGAYSAAMLHLIAHSLYKAYAFLNSGSVIVETKSVAGFSSNHAKPWIHATVLPAALVFSGVTLWGAFALAGLDYTEKPGGYLLPLILCLALGAFAWRLFVAGTPASVLTGILTIPLLSGVFTASLCAVQWLAGIPSYPTDSAISSLGYPVIGMAFVALFGVHVMLTLNLTPRWFQTLRVHAFNGFYVDAIYQRVISASTSP